MRGWAGLWLLLWLTGCAALSPPGRSGWAGRDGFRTALPLLAASGAGSSIVEIDFEAVTPQRTGALRQRGVELPRSSQGLADPRAHRDFVDLRVTAVGFGITAGGYLLYCEGLPLPVLVPEEQVDLEPTHSVAWSEAIYPDRDTALAEMGVQAAGSGGAGHAYYRGAGGALIVPTRFSPATTPRVARTMLAVRQHLSETVSRELKVLGLTLSATRVLQGVFSRIIRVGAEPELQPLARQGTSRREAPVQRPPAPQQVPVPARAPAAPTPVPGAPSPSPGLVRALAGHHRAPPVTPGPRLPQDVAVSPGVPRLRRLQRPIGPSPTQNAQLQVDIKYLSTMGAKNIRVNQQQVTVRDSQRVGINRPDLQFDYQGRRYHVEYDTPTSGRGSGHQSRAVSNDPNAETILLIVP